jgi:hypothetical protein
VLGNVHLLTHCVLLYLSGDKQGAGKVGAGSPLQQVDFSEFAAHAYNSGRGGRD